MRALTLLVLTALLAALVVGLLAHVGARSEARAADGRPESGPARPAPGLAGPELAAPAADGVAGRAPEASPHAPSSFEGLASEAPAAEPRGLEDGERPPPPAFPGEPATPSPP